MPPRFALEKIINLINSITPSTVSDSIFYSHLIHKVDELSIEESDIISQATNILQNDVYPAFNKFKECCNRLMHDSHLNGVWALPQGDEYYQYTLKKQTSTNLTPDEIHEIGLIEVKNIQDKIAKTIAALGIKSDTALTLQQLMNDEHCYYPDSKENKEKCLHTFQDILARSHQTLSHLFDLTTDTPLLVQAVPEHAQEGSPGAFYLSPDFSGNRPGIFYVNLRNTEELNKYTMEALAIHEGEPGHHLQISLQQTMDLPLFRRIKYCTSFAEGWALYCERLAYEEGFYSTVYDELGYLQGDLLRAARLVVDTGIHKKRWTYEQAIDYLQKTTGYHLNSAITEVERYFVMPGQACSYKIGQLKILELRKMAQKALGDQFDIRTFHNLVLQNGAVPLTVLEDTVKQYYGIN